jgi:hypothetical protein
MGRLMDRAIDPGLVDGRSTQKNGYARASMIQQNLGLQLSAPAAE